MKRYFLFIAADNKIERDTVFYTVRIGQSKKDQAAADVLRIIAVSRGYFLHERDNETSEFLYKIAWSLGLQVFQLKRLAIDVAELVRHFRRYNCPPPAPPLTKAASFARQILMPATYFSAQLNVIRRAEADRRNKPKSLEK